MFIETYSDENITRTFIKSSNVKAYPCGHRRSELIDTDSDLNTVTDQRYFPFDPEARLNTEANNRSHSSLNGFTQTYIKEWDYADKKILTMSLAGYLFTIELPTVARTEMVGVKPTEVSYDLSQPNTFGSDIITALTTKLSSLIAEAEKRGDIDDKTATEVRLATVTNADSIYANILLEDIKLFSGFKEYYTNILRNQPEDMDAPNTSIDLLKSNFGSTVADAQSSSNYYFSGLSFSTIPLTVAAIADGDDEKADYIKDFKTYDSKQRPTRAGTTQTIVSLRILKKVTNTWRIYQPALLPKIEHGTTEDSIVVYGATTLKGTDKKLTVEGTAEIVGDTTIDSNLKVEDNINVGNLTSEEKVTDNNGGCIVAKNDIIAKQNLTAGQKLTVGGTADITGATAIKSSLAVGPTVTPDTANAGTITAETHVETPTLNASTSITTPSAIITSATITTAEVTTATIDTTTIDTATIADTTTDNLTVNTKAIIEEADIETADINTLTGNSAEITNITGTNTVSSANMYQNGYKVPIIELVSSEAEFQLKISRIGLKPQAEQD